MDDSFVDPHCILLTLDRVTALEDGSVGTFNRKSKEPTVNSTSDSVAPILLLILFPRMVKIDWLPFLRHSLVNLESFEYFKVIKHYFRSLRILMINYAIPQSVVFHNFYTRG